MEEARAALEHSVKALSLVVIGEIRFDIDGRISCPLAGHVDAGKSTLMGRLLYELGLIEERKHMQNERESNKMGKGSFSWAWEMDGTIEERQRYIYKQHAKCQRLTVSLFMV